MSRPRICRDPLCPPGAVQHTQSRRCRFAGPMRLRAQGRWFWLRIGPIKFD